jgi:hypothetical protein
MTRTVRARGVARCALWAFLAASVGTSAVADLDEVVGQRMGVNTEAAESQEQIDKISAENDDAIGQYRSALQRIDALRSYNNQMDQLIASQEEEKAGFRGEIDSIELIVREVTPLMLSMIDALENFVALDVPFLMEERQGRLADLHKLMRRADVTDAERYRRITEAYQIENEYGRTIETRQGELEVGGQNRQVEFLRIGRVTYLYQTLDGSETGVWDHANGTWVDSPDSRAAVRKGIRIARKQTAPDLLRLPVPAAGAIQ